MELKNLKTNKIGKNIYYVKECESTNTLAKENSNLPDGTVFLCDRQTKGRGRQGNSWVSDEDSITMSILLKPDISPKDASLLTIITGLSVKNALNKLYETDILIKWPNDLVLNKKKIAGILCEMNAQKDSLGYSVIGIGINLNFEAFPKDLENIATSLISETKKKIEKNVVITAILEEFENLYNEFLENRLKNIITDYKKSLVTLNNEVKIITPTTSYTAFCCDINEDGELIVKTNSGFETIKSGEVSVRGIFGYV